MSKHTPRKIDPHGIRFVSWLAFLLFGIFIIGFLWLTQVVFLEVYVNRTKQTDFALAADKLYTEYRIFPNDYDKTFDRIAKETGYTIDVLRIEGGRATVLYASAGYHNEGEGAQTPFVLDSSTAKVAASSGFDQGFYVKDDDVMRLMYGRYFDEEGTVLLVVSQSTQLLESTTRILRIQMVIATLVIIILSFCVSFILSSAFSQDLTRLSDSARRLAADDYSVHFDEKGFSEAKELARTLNYASTEIRKTEELRRELISNVSHDLRTPLTIIKGYAEMIRDLTGEDKAKREEQLDIIISETDRLTALVNDLLQISRIQNQNAPLVKEDFDLTETVRRATRSFNVLSLNAGYTFQCDLDDHAVVSGNEQQLEQVVYNLIGNAVNYTGADKKVFVALKIEGDRVTFRVRDTGDGMDEEQLRHIWQRYYRAAEHKRSVVGTGLGLSIVRTVLERHDADFGVESKVGAGSTFWFALPLAHGKERND